MRRFLPTALVVCGLFVAVMIGLQFVLGEPQDVTPPTNTDPGAMQHGQMHAGNAQYCAS